MLVASIGMFANTMELISVLNPTGYAIFTLAIGTIIYFAIQRSKTNKQIEAKKRNVPYHGMHNMFWYMFIGQRVELIEKQFVQSFGFKFGFNLFGKFTIMLSEPELLQLVFSKEFTNFSDRRVRILLFWTHRR